MFPFLFFSFLGLIACFFFCSFKQPILFLVPVLWKTERPINFILKIKFVFHLVWIGKEFNLCYLLSFIWMIFQCDRELLFVRWCLGRVVYQSGAMVGGYSILYFCRGGCLWDDLLGLPLCGIWFLLWNMLPPICGCITFSRYLDAVLQKNVYCC